MDLAHRLFDQADTIGPFCRGVHHPLSDHPCDFFPEISELGFSFLFADLEFSLCKDLLDDLLSIRRVECLHQIGCGCSLTLGDVGEDLRNLEDLIDILLSTSQAVSGISI